MLVYKISVYPPESSSWLQATTASLSSHQSWHTVPHWLLKHTSTRPSNWSSWFPASLMSPWEHRLQHTHSNWKVCTCTYCIRLILLPGYQSSFKDSEDKEGCKKSHRSHCSCHYNIWSLNKLVSLVSWEYLCCQLLVFYTHPSMVVTIGDFTWGNTWESTSGTATSYYLGQNSWSKQLVSGNAGPFVVNHGWHQVSKLGCSPGFSQWIEWPARRFGATCKHVCSCQPHHSLVEFAHVA